MNEHGSEDQHKDTSEMTYEARKARVRRWFDDQVQENGLIDVKFFPSHSRDETERDFVQSLESIVYAIEDGDYEELPAPSPDVIR